MKSSQPKKYEDGLDILVSKIIIWDSNGSYNIEAKDPPEDKCLIIRECESIEIEESYRKLIGTASVKFPKGTVINKTETLYDLDNIGAKKVYVDRLSNGAIIERRSHGYAAKPTDFKVGQRIRIYLGYFRDTGKVFNKKSERIAEMERVALSHAPNFDGFITKCSISTPIELRCENIASCLKRKTCPPKTEINDATVHDIIKEGGLCDLLGGTGLKLHPDTLNENIEIGKIQLSDNQTVADVLTEWGKFGLYCYIVYEGNVPYIKIGMPYSKSKKKEISDGNSSSKPTVIQFNYHVSNDNLTLMKTDPAFLAVAAEGFKMEGNKFIKYSITIRLNPEWTGVNDTQHKKFQLLNETKLSKKAMKAGAESMSDTKSKVDLSQYNIVSYVSRKTNVTEKELVEEAEEYFENYNRNGVEGTLEIFGDLQIRTGAIVELLDTRMPEKNGYYRVEEVNTKFGTHGFRQTLKLPYCIVKPDKE